MLRNFGMALSATLLAAFTFVTTPADAYYRQGVGIDPAVLAASGYQHHGNLRGGDNQQVQIRQRTRYQEVQIVRHSSGVCTRAGVRCPCPPRRTVRTTPAVVPAPCGGCNTAAVAVDPVCKPGFHLIPGPGVRGVLCVPLR